MVATQFKGYAVKDHKNFTDFDIIEFEPKKWTEDDIEIQITHCGVCGSDVHTITGGWGEAQLPLVVGHEIVGKAVRVGKNVKSIKEGDRVGVGAQIGACLECRACKTNNENYCPKQVDTYNANYPDGTKTQGGYATAIRAHEQFVFPIPDKLESKDAASMLCAGLTVYSPLKRNGAGPGKKVGVIGIGGLGHYAVLFAQALGAEVFAFTHSDSKDDDIKQMGLDEDHIINTSKEGFEEKFAMTLDLIISTRDVAEGYPLDKYLSMLWIHGSLITCGLPDEPFPPLKGMDLAPNGAKLGGSHIGSKAEVLEMLDLAANKGVKPWIEELPMSRVAEAIKGVESNKVRYRYVLTQDLV